MSSPMQRSLKAMRDAGYLAGIVERRLAFNRVTVDLFGCIDIVAVRGTETVGIQTTTSSNAAARLAKIRDTPAAALWLAGGARRLVVHGWVKRGKRSKRKLWELREIEVTAELLGGGTKCQKHQDSTSSQATG